MNRRDAIALLATTAICGLTACGGDDRPAGPTAVPGTSGVQIEFGNTINYGSFGTTATVDCADGKSLNVGGSNNTLTVTGTCSSVNVGGADNKITLAKIDKDLSVVGLNNTIVYEDGEPRVNNLGTGNDIRKP